MRDELSMGKEIHRRYCLPSAPFSEWSIYEWKAPSKGCVLRLLMLLQFRAVTRAFQGWIYVAPLVPDTTAVRDFMHEVKVVTERDFAVAVGDDVDPAAARLHDAIILWANAYSRVVKNNGGPFLAAE